MSSRTASGAAGYRRGQDPEKHGCPICEKPGTDRQQKLFLLQPGLPLCHLTKNIKQILRKT